MQRVNVVKLCPFCFLLLISSASSESASAPAASAAEAAAAAAAAEVAAVVEELDVAVLHVLLVLAHGLLRISLAVKIKSTLNTGVSMRLLSHTSDPDPRTMLT